VTVALAAGSRAPRPAWAFTAGAGAVALIAYVVTLLPGVGYGGDTAKFQFLGRVLGIGHPTGYPVYLLLNWSFGQLPIGTLAYRINLLSAVLGAAATALFVPVLRRLGAGRYAPIGALWIGLSYTFWSQAIIAEVYTLHALYLAAALGAILSWGEEGRASGLAWSLFFIGLAFSHHLLIVTAIAGFLAYALATDARALLGRRALLGAAAGGLAGTLPYAYLFWRTAAQAPYLEGKVRTLGELAAFVSGGPFRSSMAILGESASLGPRIAELLRYVALEWTPVGWLFVPLGAALLCRARPRAALLLGMIAAGDLLFAATYDVPDWFVFLLPFYLVSGVVAVQVLPPIERLLTPRLGARAAVTLTLGLGLGLTAALAITNGRLLDRSGDVEAERSSRAILDAVGAPAVILSADYDVANYLYYHLLTQSPYREREVYVVQSIGWDALRAYLAGSGRLPQREHGPAEGVPPGLPAFVASNADEYERAGFGLEPVAGAGSRLFHLAGSSAAAPPPK
jgi:hypothetical protein